MHIPVHVLCIKLLNFLVIMGAPPRVFCLMDVVRLFFIFYQSTITVAGTALMSFHMYG